MSAIAGIRQIIAGVITARTTGWTESPWPYPLFPGPESRQIVARSYAVGVLSTQTETRDRQPLAVGALVTSIVGVRFSTRVRAGGQLLDYDAGMDAELELVAAILADRDLVASLRLDSVPTREIVADGTVYLGELRFTCRHMYPLTAS